MRTMETGCTAVDIIVWKENEPWQGRYGTRGIIEQGVCRFLLSREVFADPQRANAAYRRFARRIREEGGIAPNVIFQTMTSRASRNMFCFLSTTQSVFNSACMPGKLSVIESGIDERRTLMALVRDTEEQE